MSSGSSKNKAPKITAPTPVTKVGYDLPTGDQFSTVTSGKSQSFTSRLAPQTQRIVDTAQGGLESLANEMIEPSEKRVQSIRDRADDFYDTQARGINETSDLLLKRTQSDLGKRFGGAFNATFGNELQSRVLRDQGDRLYNARKEANLLGEDLYRDDETSRAQRFQVFQNYLGDLNNQARGLAANSSDVLSNERDRSTRVALAQAQLDQQYAQMAATQRANALNSYVKLATGIAGASTGSPASLLTGAFLGK